MHSRLDTVLCISVSGVLSLSNEKLIQQHSFVVSYAFRHFNTLGSQMKELYRYSEYSLLKTVLP